MRLAIEQTQAFQTARLTDLLLDPRLESRGHRQHDLKMGVTTLEPLRMGITEASG